MQMSVPESSEAARRAQVAAMVSAVGSSATMGQLVAVRRKI